jgi:hypothetical protein
MGKNRLPYAFAGTPNLCWQVVLHVRSMTLSGKEQEEKCENTAPAISSQAEAAPPIDLKPEGGVFS